MALTYTALAKGFTGSVTSVAYTLTTGVPAGALVVIAAGGGGGGQSAATDSKGNTYGVAGRVSGQANGGDHTLLYSVLTTALVSGDTITISKATAGSYQVTITAVTGATFSAQASVLDQTATVNPATGAAAATAASIGPTAATTQASELVFASFFLDGTPTGVTPGTGYTTDPNGLQPSSTGARGTWSEYRELSATGAQTATATVAPASHTAGVLATFKFTPTPPTVRGAGAMTSGAAATALSFPFPAAQAGDILELSFETGTTASVLAASGHDLLAANGWTILDTSPATPTDHRGWIALKKLTAAVAGGGTVAVTMTAATDFVGRCTVWDGATVDQTTPWIAPTGRHTNGATVNSWASPTLTTDVANCVVLARFFGDPSGTGRTWTATSSVAGTLTEDFDTQITALDTIAGYSQTLAAAGAVTITGTITGTATQMSSAIMALRPYGSSAAAPVAPTVALAAVSGVGATAATLNGTVNPQGQATTYQFQFGTTTAYGTNSPVSAASAGSGSSAVAVTAALTGLSPSTTYHYRLTATNATGTANTSDGTFTTSAPPDTTPPDTTISSPSAGQTFASGVSISATFSSTESGSTFQGRIDGGAWQTVSSPWTVGVLAAGSHTLDVRATDAAGNVDATPATVTFTVAAATVPDPVRTAASNVRASWKFILARSLDLSNIGELTQARGRQLQLVLNRAGSLSFTIPMDDELGSQIQPVTHAVKAYRLGSTGTQLVWSGFVNTIDEDVSNNRMTVNCVGWLDRLSKRVLRSQAQFTAADDGAMIRELLVHGNAVSGGEHPSAINSATPYERVAPSWNSALSATRLGAGVLTGASVTTDARLFFFDTNASGGTVQIAYAATSGTFLTLLDSTGVAPTQSNTGSLLTVTVQPSKRYYVSLVSTSQGTVTMTLSGPVDAPSSLLRWPSGSSPNTPTWLTWGGTLPNEGVGGVTAYTDLTTITVTQPDGSTTTAARNGTYPPWQTNILSTIQQLTEIENGCDVSVDPATRALYVYRKRRRVLSSVVLGWRFGPENVAQFNRQLDGSALANFGLATGSATVAGQFADDRAMPTPYSSQLAYGPLEEVYSLSDVDQAKTLGAYAAAEILLKYIPRQMYSITPFNWTPDNSVPEPFVDYRIGDQVTFVARQLPRVAINQQVRIFGISVAIDEESNEKLGQLQIYPGG